MASRFLTPKDISLLALLSIYCDAAVPAEGILPVLGFIARHTGTDATKNAPDPQQRFQKAQEAIDLIKSIKVFEPLLQPYHAAVGLPGRRLWDLFLAKLWAIDSLDALHQFFDQLPSLLANKEDIRHMAEAESGDTTGRNFLTTSSPFGLFARRAHLEHSRLPFFEAATLWKDFVVYRQPTAGAWARRNPSSNPSFFDRVLEDGVVEWGGRATFVADIIYGDMNASSIPISVNSLDGLIEYQVAQMQKYGVRVPEELHKQFAELLEASRANPKLSHYLKFLEAWRSGDYPTSFDYLHQYFDYTMQNSDREHYHYALLNLAVLQADFGCHKDAVSTILETIATAREKRDTNCLNFALNFYYNFGLQHPDLVENVESSSMSATGRETLEYLKIKAKESGMWSTWSHALLSEAKQGLVSGDSVATALEKVATSSHLVTEHGLTNMVGTQFAMTIAFWDRAGVSFLSTMLCEVFLRCHAVNAILDDSLKITCRLASLLASKGRYNEGMHLLEEVGGDSLRTWKANKYWQKLRGLIKLRRDLHRNDLDGAEYLLNQILQSKPDDLEPDLVFVVDSLHYELLIRRGDLQAAFTKVEQLISGTQDQDKDIALRVRLLLMKAHLFQKAGRPQRGFTIVMRAANLAWKTRLMNLLWQSIGSLADILNSLGEFEAAKDLLLVIIPRSLECELGYFVANLYSSLADAYVGIAGKVGAPEGHAAARARLEHLARAMEPLKRAFDYYAMMDDVQKKLEVTAKMAMIMRVRGETKVADDLAAKYLELRTGGLTI
ncbi:anaphase-promoting complex subunit 5-domain-containing protein [Coniella lustricola]|uniref:Anaphase-promoting complex subunit 5 n=1 Tax=Coniella lustricola TaxID=2025994 RepID=A0A2T3ALM1_9PEZI|nr:anaphase-promoting complex subunit 5-domain-containing protein [Coniella lustricola]